MRIAFLANPTNRNADALSKEIQEAARALGKEVVALSASNEPDIDAAFASLVQQRAGALLVGADAFFLSRRNQLIALATRETIPAIYQQREFGGSIRIRPTRLRLR
jgi:putative tryptophan/tyrosine transport system substrate-binding protein